MPRLRQAVVVARELDPAVERLRSGLGLGPPYADPGVALFGLRNAVMPLGDTFVEVVSPAEPDTAAGRHLERRGGDAAYMLLFEVDDLGAARRRLARLGARVAWEIDLPEISGTHLHPHETPGALVSLDEPRPPGSWHWAGPEWRPAGAARLAGARLAVAEPEDAAARWAEVLGEPPAGLVFEEGTEGLHTFVVEGLEHPVTLGAASFVPAPG